MKLKTSSWKQKIDPAFDKFIKIYLKFLGKSMLPGNEGYLVLDDRRGSGESQVFNFSMFGNVTRYEYKAVYGLPLKITDANLKRKRFRSLILLFYFECIIYFIRRPLRIGYDRAL